MRKTCTDCALKHLSQASILLQESKQGYPLHRHYALGHMAEAEAELISRYPEHAALVRTQRKNLEDNPGHKPDFNTLINKIDKECDTCDLRAERANPGFHAHCTPKSTSKKCRLQRCIKKVEKTGSAINAYAICKKTIYSKSATHG